MTSISVTPSARAASSTCWKSSFGIGAAYLDLAEARGACAVAGADDLLGLPLAAIGDAPQRPVSPARDGGAGVPEFGGDAAIAGVLQHARALAAANLPGDLAAKLKVVALVVDGPTAIGLHINAAVHVEDFFERLLAGLQAHIGHADQ